MHMNEKSRGFARIDVLIAEMGGEDEFLDHLLGRVIEGEALKDVGAAFGIAYGSLWRWLNDDQDRMREYEVSLKGHADMVVHETKAIADGSDDPKLRVDTRKWLSSKWDRNRFSESSKVEVSGSVSLINLLASLKELPPDTAPPAIEGESEVIEFQAITSPEKIPAKIPEISDEVVI